MIADFNAVAALYKHRVAADAVRATVTKRGLSEEAEVHFKERLGKDAYELAVTFSGIQRLTVFYALLHVVVDGYRDFGLSDPEVDDVLNQGDYVDLLRRFRNTTFHYHEDPFNAKLVDLLLREDSEKWIRHLYDALSGFFRRAFPIENTLRQIGKYVESSRESTWELPTELR